MPKTQPTIPENDRIFLKRYLSQYYTAKRRKAVLAKRLEELRRELHDPSIPGPGLSGMPKQGHQSSGSASLVFKLAEIEDRINRQVEIEASAVLSVMQMLDFLPPDSTEKEIMELRHIDCCTWDNIADQVHFSKMQCFRYYNGVLEKLYSFKKVRLMVAEFQASVERTEKDGY
ncbi:MAG: hypothetical protein LUG55_08210 [Clostridiales bacterium]|nr:hypothetical protein [Clostridiales bacterium]